MPARRGRTSGAGGIEPLTPQKKWRAITLATLLVVPAYWMLLAGFVARERGEEAGAPDPGASLAFGLAIIPFVYIVLAFTSQHPRAPMAVLKAMGLTLLIGIPVSAIAGDAVTGMVAGIGAGGIAALRKEERHHWKPRAVAVGAAALLVFVLVRAAGPIALLPAPVLPFTAIGVADHLSERDRGGRARAGSREDAP